MMYFIFPLCNQGHIEKRKVSLKKTKKQQEENLSENQMQKTFNKYSFSYSIGVYFLHNYTVAAKTFGTDGKACGILMRSEL